VQNTQKGGPTGIKKKERHYSKGTLRKGSRTIQCQLWFKPFMSIAKKTRKRRGDNYRGGQKLLVKV